jgi:hypothetical protein
MTDDDFDKILKEHPYCDRVRGFWYGFHNLHGPAKDFLGNAEYKRGWDEGVGLLLDERRALAAQRLR